MGRLLVKARSVSIRQRASSRASSRDDQVLRPCEKNKSVGFLVGAVCDRHAGDFPKASRARGRSKKRRNNKEFEILEGHYCEDGQLHSGKRAKKKRTVASSKENQGGKSNSFSRSSTMDDANSMALYEAFECVARVDNDLHNKAEKYRNQRENHNRDRNRDRNRNKDHSRDRNKDHNKNGNKNKDLSEKQNKDRNKDRSEKQNKDRSEDRNKDRSKDRNKDRNRYGAFFKILGATAAPSLSKTNSNSISASTFVKALGKLGHSWWGSDEVKGAECRDEINNVGRRRRTRHTATGNHYIMGRGEDKASEDDPRDEAAQYEEEEEVDPIFESGSYRNQSNTESSVNLWLAQTMLTDNRGSDIGVSKDELRDDRVSDDIVVASDDSGAEIFERKTSRVFRMHNKQRKSSYLSSSLEPEQLWLRKQDKRNELAWVRCAGPNRKRPLGLPISKSRKQPQDNDDEETLTGIANVSYSLFPWIPSCGEGFVIS